MRIIAIVLGIVGEGEVLLSAVTTHNGSTGAIQTCFRVFTASPVTICMGKLQRLGRNEGASSLSHIEKEIEK